MAAKSGIAGACCCTDIPWRPLYREGLGVPHARELARDWYEKAEAQGEPQAKERLSFLEKIKAGKGITLEQFGIALCWSFAVAVVAVCIPFIMKTLLSQSQLPGWGREAPIVFAILLPFVQGFLTGLQMGRYSARVWLYVGATLLIWLLDVCCAYFAFGEGALCLIFVSPIIIPAIAVGLAVGMAVGKAYLRRGLNKTIYASVLPLFLLLSAYGAVQPKPDYGTAISDAVVVNAPPESIWRYIIQYPENKAPPEYWLWQIGLPTPIQSVADGKKIGAVRECRFTKGIVFKEKLTEVVPNKMLTFDITEQPEHPEIIGHFRLEKGQLQLKPNGDGTTTVTAISWYRLYVSPVFYFDLWASDIVRKVHFRVLNHMKDLAEADYMKKKAR